MKHITKIKNKFTGFSWTLALFLGLAWPVMGQTTYTWNTTTGSWSTSSNWTTAGPGSTYPGSLDTATINNLTANSTITFDTGVTGNTLTNLSINQSSSSTVTTQLKLAKSLSVSGTVTLDDSASATSLANDTISLNSNTLTVGNLNLGSSSDSTAINGYSTLIYGDSAGASALSVSGAFTLTTVSTLANYFVIGSGAGNFVSTAINGTLDVVNTGTGGARYYQNGNFSVAASGTIEVTGTHAANFGGFYIDGATDSIGSSVTFSGLPTNANSAFIFENQYIGSTTQSITANTAFTYAIENYQTGTVGTPLTLTQKYTNSTTGNAVDQLYLTNGKAYATQVVQLGSNLVLASGQYSPFYFSGVTSNAGSTQTIDLAGFTYDASTNASVGFAPSTSSNSVSNITPTSTTSDTLLIKNSGTSSISGGNGVFKATYFNLASADLGIASGVILQATATGVTNDLGQVTETGTTYDTTSVDPGSTFYYTGAGSANLKVSPALTGGTARSIGAVIVGTGSSASTLVLTSAVTAAGNVTSATSATLDLGGKALTLSGASNLIGGGSIANTGGTASGNPITFGTGGLTPGGGIAGATTATLTLNSAVGVTLNSGTTSTFNLASTSAYDKVSGGTFTLAGALDVDLMTGFSAGSGATFNLFSGSALSGGFADASSVMLVGNPSLDAAYTATFNNSTGVLTVSSVPEPGTGALFVLGAMALGVAHLRKRQSSI